ncbi:ACP phosphodiesterase [Crenobacter caeni]|uniref:DUF479 domain-containing protein n=1 Tax=Crenobacter caeni TaxID=2705474 RepID=A0A6B2KV35_9NEIS|nr:ACP phosphodiesterase [Crenobacter caeni]NDV14008.1 DUF479 domain-containing protein [Crenobacter caeni]
MNYLAHLALSPDDTAVRLGNLMGDFCRKAELSALPPAFLDGYALHQHIDRYTDAHPLHRQSRARISARRARYSGVLIDLFYDHFLARHWDRWYTPDLGRFAQDVYHALDANRALLPVRLAQVAPLMRADDWLVAYREVDGIARVIDAFARHRARAGNPLTGSACELLANYAALEADFFAFYPQLAAEAAAFSARPAAAAAARAPRPT